MTRKRGRFVVFDKNFIKFFLMLKKKFIKLCRKMFVKSQKWNLFCFNYLVFNIG